MPNRLVSLLIAFTFTSFSTKVFSSHLLGGDIAYACTSTPGQYQVTLTLYRDCGGQTFCTGTCNSSCTYTLNIVGADSIYNGTSYGTFQLNLMSVSDVNPNPICANAKNICTNMGCVTAGSYTPGIEKFIFQGMVNLGSTSGIPSACCNLRISITPINYRTGAISTGPAGSPLYIESIVNRCIAPCNSSPTLMNDPVMIMYGGMPYVFNLGANDPDHDSLTYSFTPALTSIGTSATYIAPYSYYIPMPYYPPMNGGFPLGMVCDTFNGNFAWTSPYGGSGIFVCIVTIMVKQWRTVNGIRKLIGTTTREYLCNLMQGPPDIPPHFNTTPTDTSYGRVSGNNYSYSNSRYQDKWTVAVGQPLCFDIIAKDTDFNPPTYSDTTYLTWDGVLAQYGATFISNYVDSLRKINGPREDTKKFCWTPDSSKINNLPWYFTVTAKDSRCPNPGRMTAAFAITVVNDINCSISQSRKGCYRVQLTYTQTGSTQPISSSMWTISRIPNDYSLSNADVFLNSVSTSFLSFAQAGKYLAKLKITTSAGLQKYFFDTIRIDTPLSISVNDTISCPGTAVTFQYLAHGGNSPYTYRWFIAPDTSINILNISNVNSTSFSVNPASSTRYTLQVTDVKGCKGYDSTIMVNVRPIPVITLPSSIRICSGNTYTFNPGNNSGNVKKYLWNTGDSTQTLTKSDSNIYSVTLTDTSGCMLTQTTQLYVNNPVNVNAGLDTTICGINTITLHGTGGQTYQWVNLSTLIMIGSSANQSALAGSTTSFQLTAYVTQSGLQCSKKDTVVVNVNALPVSTLGSTTRICSGTSFTLDPGNNGGKPVSYLWNTGDTTRTITRGDSNTFVVTLKDTNNCRTTSTFALNVNQPVKAFAGYDTTACANKTLTLHATGGQSYQWRNINTNTILGAKSNNPNTSVIISSTTFYEATVYATQSALECSNKDTVIVNVANPVAVSSGSTKTFCSNDAPLNLTTSQSASPAGGTWSGSGVNYISGNYQFNPALANFTPSINTLYYLMNNPPCYNYDSVLFTVKAKPALPIVTGQGGAVSGQTNSYNVTNNSGSSFNWFTTIGSISSGQGTNQVNVLFNMAGNGAVKVVEIAYNSCKSDTAYKTITVSGVGGINEQNVFDHFNVYPNPTTSVLNIEFESSEKNIELNVLDLTGRSVFTTIEKHQGGMLHKTLDLSSISHGVYFIRIQAGEKSTNVKVTIE